MELKLYNNRGLVYTNGAYDIYGYEYGFWRWKRVCGIVVRTQYMMTYHIGQEVNFPTYNTLTSPKTQFILKKNYNN